MPKPVCVACRCFYRPEKNGFRWIEGKPIGGTAYNGRNIRGNNAPDCWEPYKVWNADLWECPECHHQIIVGCGERPISQDYKIGFEEECESAMVQINDC